MRFSLIFLAILILSHGQSVSGQSVTFTFLPNNAGSANDMSPDGRFIVGNLINFGPPYLYDTETGSFTILPAPGIDAIAVSDDGTVVAGNIPDPEGIGLNVAARWTAASGWVSLGHLPDALACPSLSDAFEMSADGSVITGLSWDGCSGRGFIWTEKSGMLELEALANGGNRASVVSADGTLFGGFAQGSFSRTPCFWHDNQEGELLDPPDGDALGEIHGMRDDGSIMLGEWVGGSETTAPAASTWTFNGSTWDREQIAAGSLLPGWSGIPLDIADDNTIIGFDFLQGARRAWIQYQGQGELVLLKAWANSLGAKIPAAQQLEVPQAISVDGSKICGHGFVGGAWLMTITPDVLIGDVNQDGAVNLLDVSPFVELISSGGFLAEADINKDGFVNLLDVSPFVSLLSGN